MSKDLNYQNNSTNSKDQIITDAERRKALMGNAVVA